MRLTKLFKRSSKNKTNSDDGVSQTTGSVQAGASTPSITGVTESQATTPDASDIATAPAGNESNIQEDLEPQRVVVTQTEPESANYQPTSAVGHATTEPGNANSVRVTPYNLLQDRRHLRTNHADGSLSEPQTAEFIIPRKASLITLWWKISEAGFVWPKRIQDRAGKCWDEDATKVKFEPFEEVEVINGQSECERFIDVNERLTSFTNRNHGYKIEWDIEEEIYTDGKVSHVLKDQRGLRMKFLRTVRMPDDGKLHPLPAALGTFPLYNVTEYADRLPSNIVHDGGVFIPMWQREALWISFLCHCLAEYAVRVSVGRINAVSGASIDPLPDSTSGHVLAQDYVVVPGQEWLDGICVGPGVVRQFVAMPLGSGYTIEGQKTGEEKHGGLQIEIIPSFEQHLRKLALSASMPVDPESHYTTHNPPPWLDENKTPRELGLKPGDRLRSYPTPAFNETRCVMADLAHETEQEVELSAVYPKRAAYSPDTSYDDDLYASCAQDEPYTSSAAFHPAHAPLARSNVDEELSEATSDVKSMGLAAGGLLMQDIYKDKNDAAIWNTAASKLINVHILDPASCENVTHVVPAPPPIDAKTYAESNMPFYVVEERLDERMDSGDFNDIKSVSAMDKMKMNMEEKPLDPTILQSCRCQIRMCDCVIRPCNHQFCHVCIKGVDNISVDRKSSHGQALQGTDNVCPVCQMTVSHVAGFSAPMNLPGEETIKMRVPVNVLEVQDGRSAFKSIQRLRI